MTRITLLSLDPSSTKTGYAIGTGPLSLIEAGILKPRGDNAIIRAESMAADLPDLIERYGVNRAIVEIPAPQAPKTTNRGQATYGMAVGIILGRLRQLLPGRVEHSAADEWTRRVNKRHRQLCVASDFPGYSLDRDSGADCADAVGLLQWWFKQRTLKGE